MKGEQRSITPTTNTILVLSTSGNAGYPMSALVKNLGPGTLYLGGVGVTSSTGFGLLTDESLVIDMVNEHLHGITTATSNVHILRRYD